MKPWINCYIGLGSNLDNPLQQVTDAIQHLSQHPHLRTIKASTLYSSKPVGPQDQPDFINAVAQLQTQLGPHDLLDVLQSIEQAHHRKRLRHWGERSLDLDLLLYGQSQIHTPRLTVPHALMLERSFVLYPLAELCPERLLPNGQLLKDHLSRIPFDLTPITS